jgi:hypothetical protein
MAVSISEGARPASRHSALLRDRAFLLLVAGGLALRLAWALLPLNAHLLLLEDDAWMVTAIARNFALGNGISADGAHPTTGFHPLYPLTLGALPYLLRPGDLDFGFRANLVICALLNAAALLPLYALLRRAAQRPIALLCLGLAALNPLLVRFSVNAMETSLALLLLLTLAWAFAALDKSRPRTAVALGALAALCALARIDTALFGAALALFWIGDWRLEIGDWRKSLQNLRSPISNLALYGVTAALLLLPYFARNYLVTGSLSPSSGRALAYMHSYADSFALSSGVQIANYQSLLDLSWLPGSLASALVIAVALSLGWWLIPRGRGALIAPTLLYAAALTCYYAYLQNQGQPRYYVGVSLLLLMPLALTLEGAAKRFGRRAALTAATALLLASVALNGAAVGRAYGEAVARGGAQASMFAAARWIASNLPPDALLAARNSGIYQYYSQRTVLNIDGKLNHEIVPVLERRGLRDYLADQGAAYVVDLPQVCGYIEFYSHQYGDAKPHAEMGSAARLRAYAELLLRALRLGPGPQLDPPVPDACGGRFTAEAPPIQTFPLLRGPDAVTIYQLP